MKPLYSHLTAPAAVAAKPIGHCGRATGRGACGVLIWESRVPAHAAAARACRPRAGCKGETIIDRAESGSQKWAIRTQPPPTLMHAKRPLTGANVPAGQALHAAAPKLDE